jgi:hypothetical protein
MIHELKVWPEYFEEIFCNRKKFEVRKNDRNFQVGDLLYLREYDPFTNEYTGRWNQRQITYILDNNNSFIELGENVILSIK